MYDLLQIQIITRSFPLQAPSLIMYGLTFVTAQIADISEPDKSLHFNVVIKRT